MREISVKRLWFVLSGGAALILVASYVSLTHGEFDMTLQEVIQTLLRIHPTPQLDLVIFDFRLPRIVIAALVGLGLGIAGAAVQGVTRNGLADPGILGINAGAGAAIVIFMFFYQGQMETTGWTAALAMPFFGLIGGLVAALLIYLFAWKAGRLDSQRLLLVGIAIGSGFGSLSLYLSLKMKASDFEMATVWMSGSIWSADWKLVAAVIPWLVILIPVIWLKSYVLDLFQLHEHTAKSLGVATEKEKSILLLSSIGLVSACVSVSGGIGFVGLLSPHIARRLVGLHHRFVIPVCGMIGMVLVLLSDFIAKTVVAPAEIPVGLIIAVIGVPYFVVLLMKKTA
ncbi:iron ABC transporter permease [Paenibacillus jamilae]|uniref:Iron ABC transporter permease n=1 Tax=Paenibacillus jamilae TaxID=114136 RepID=A0ACC4ZT24_9BACL|nr:MULTISPECIES: iron ABC transporter permease [Paenibacillus]AUO05209.1 iron ABC transporter permease [Paenibacillus sp. lzh-N1]KTS81477.1 iron ABC transporter permease [Paenibacillus jamilae]